MENYRFENSVFHEDLKRNLEKKRIFQFGDKRLYTLLVGLIVYEMELHHDAVPYLNSYGIPF